MPQALAPSQLPKEYQGGVIWGYVVDNPTTVATEGTQGQFVVLLPGGGLYQKNDEGKTTNWTLKTFGTAFNLTVGGVSNVTDIQTDSTITVTDDGGGQVTLSAVPTPFNLQVGSVMNVDNIQFSGASVVNDGSGQVTVTVTPFNLSVGAFSNIDSITSSSLVITNPSTGVANIEVTPFDLTVGAVTNVNDIQFSGATVTDDGSGQVTVTITPSVPTGTLNTIAFFNSSGNLASDANFSYDDNKKVIRFGTTIPAAGTGASAQNSILMGDGFSFGTNPAQSFIFGHGHTSTTSPSNSIMGGQSLNGTGGTIQNSVIVGQNISYNNPCVINNSIVSGSAHSFGNNSIIGSLVAGTSLSMLASIANEGDIQNSVITANGLTLANNPNNFLHSMCITGASISFNGSAINSYSAIFGNSISFSQNVVGSVIAGQSSTFSGPVTSSFIGMTASSTFSFDVSASVVVGAGDATGLIFNSFVSLRNSSNVNTVLDSFVSSNSSSVVNGSIDDSLAVMSGCQVGSSGIQFTALVGSGHLVDSNNYCAIFGDSHNTTNGAGHVFFAGLGHVSASDYQAAVGRYANIGSNDAFNVGNGTSNVALSNAWSVAKDGLVTETGAKRVKARQDSGATVTINVTTDYFVRCTNSGATDANLPAGVDGQEYILKAGTSTNLTVNASGGDTIDGNPTQSVGPGTSLHLIFLSGDWSIIQ